MAQTTPKIYYAINDITNYHGYSTALDDQPILVQGMPDKTFALSLLAQKRRDNPTRKFGLLQHFAGRYGFGYTDETL